MKSNFLSVFKYELKGLLLSPKRLFYVLVFPLMLFGFLSALFHQGVPRDLPMALLDEDQSQLSAQLIRALDATPSMKMSVNVTDEHQAQKLIQQQKVYGFVRIPKEFQSKILQGKGQEVICYTNNQFILTAGLIQKDFQVVIGMFSAGISVKQKTQKGVQMQKALSEAQPVRVDEHALFNPFSNNAFYLLTALFPMMLQMIVIMITMYVLGVDFKYNQGKRWLHRAGGNHKVALLGKVLPYTLVLFFVAWCMNFLLFKWIGTPLQVSMLSVMIISFLLVLVYQVIGFLLISFIPDFRGALTIGSGFTAIAFSFAAYTFPIEGLPTSMQLLADIFPFTHFTEYFVNRAVKGIPFIFTWKPLLVLTGYLLLLVMAYPRFVKRIEKGGYEKN
ncbi:ABC transporter permease [Capnocytophaga canimorsus]|uniref:ABC transporter permease n=1 Tax=Capnocytophaga canimorsus TaxID=28188 RepID=UPI0037D35983